MKTGTMLFLTSLFLAQAAQADLINGSFETGTFSGWSTVGITSIQTSSFMSGPTDGTYEALMETGNDSSIGNGAGVDAETLEGFLKLPDAGLDTISTGIPQGGSAVTQSTFAFGGQTLLLDWNFLTTETIPDLAFNDFAFVSIVPDGGGPAAVFLLGDTFSSLTPSLTPFPLETGFQTFSYLFPTSGMYTIGIGISNVGDVFNDSGILLDNVRIVPEPGGIRLLGVGLLGLLVRSAFVARRSSGNR